jgi:hypothetical protein
MKFTHRHDYQAPPWLYYSHISPDGAWFTWSGIGNSINQSSIKILAERTVSWMHTGRNESREIVPCHKMWLRQNLRSPPDVDTGCSPCKKNSPRLLARPQIISLSVQKHLLSCLNFSYVIVPESSKNLRLLQYSSIVSVHWTTEPVGFRKCHWTVFPISLRCFCSCDHSFWAATWSGGEVVSTALDRRRHVSTPHPLLSWQLTTLGLHVVTNVPPSLFSTWTSHASPSTTLSYSLTQRARCLKWPVTGLNHDSWNLFQWFSPEKNLSNNYRSYLFGN